MTLIAPAPRSLTIPVTKLDDPDYELAICASGDYRTWRSRAVEKEPWTYDWLKEIGTGVLYDVGACVGSYSLMAAARGARVIALEPVPWNYGDCVANACLNGFSDRITVLPFAIGAEDGVRKLRHMPAPVSGWGEAATGWQPANEKAWEFTVTQVSLATITEGYGPATHVKIDVEGDEIDVLRGMNFEGVESIICEVHNKDHEMDALGIVQAHGFESVWWGGMRTNDQRTHIFRRRA